MVGSKKYSGIKKTLLFLGLFVSCLYLGFSFFMEDKIAAQRKVPSPFLKVYGISDSSSLEITYDGSGIYKKLPVTDGIAEIPEEAKDNFSLPYKLYARIKNKNGTEQNIAWTLDKSGKYYTMLLTGFEKRDRVKISLNDSIPVNEAPLDWSGRMFVHYVIPPTWDTNACVTVTEDKNQMRFCLMLTGKA